MPNSMGKHRAKILSWAGTIVAFGFIIFAIWLFVRALHRYDFLAARSAGMAVSLPRASKAAFVGNSLTNNIGFSLLTSTSVRYRYYLAWGFSALQIAQFITLAN